MLMSLQFLSTLCLLAIPHVGSNKERRHFSTLYRKNLLHMISMLDEDVEPCDDFFQHACGYYEQTLNFDAPEEEDTILQVPPMLYNHEDRMHFFEEQHRNFKSSVGKLLSRLYVECKQLKSSNTPLYLWKRMLQQLPFLLPYASHLRNWPFLHYQWAELHEASVELNWAVLAAELAAHGVQTTLLHIFFAEQTIYIAPSADALLCNNLTVIRKSLLPLLHGRNEQIAEIIANELLLFCRELNGESVSLEKTDDALQNETDLFENEMLSIYFQTFFTQLNFTETDVRASRKVVVDLPRINDMLRVYRQTEPRIIYNFIIWRAFETLKSACSDCFLLTEQFEQLLLSEYWQWHVFEQHFRREVALATYVFHTTRFQQQRKSILMGDNWTAFLESKLQRKDFNVPRLLKNYANEQLAPEALAAIYTPLQWRRGAFYANLLLMQRLKIRATFIQPHQDIEDLQHPHYFLRQFLYFCILIIKEPLFHYFATQGFDLWDASQLLHSTDGYYTALDCLERQTLLYFDDELDASIFHFLSEDEVLRIFNFYRAFLASYRDYHFWLQGEFFAFAEDFVLEFFQLDSRRIMFYAVAQQHCGRNNDLYASLINRSYMNLPVFHESFNCTLEAPMNPVVKCIISSCDDI